MMGTTMPARPMLPASSRAHYSSHLNRNRRPHIREFRSSTLGSRTTGHGSAPATHLVAAAKVLVAVVAARWVQQ